MAETARPQLVAPRQLATVEAVRNLTGGHFDADAWYIMDQRDNALIADEVLHGPGSSTFVYSFPLQGSTVSGISVIGARHLANHYKGLKHRLVAAQQKSAALFTFTSYPAENMPMAVSCSVVPELADEPDFYAAVVEVTDIKTGNSLQVERRELRYEDRRGGGSFERPHYATIAQSKAYRNAVLALIPQDVAIQWKANMLQLQKGEVITASVLEEKRAGVLRFAAQRGVALDRQAIERLTLDQIAGLGDAAREGRLPAFVTAVQALGIEVGQPEEPPPRRRSLETPRPVAPAAAPAVADDEALPEEDAAPGDGNGVYDDETPAAAVAEPENESAPEAAPPESFGVPLLMPKKTGRTSYDWPRFADDAIAAGRRLDRRQLREFRVVHAHTFDRMRLSNKDEWSRLQQDLADHERELP
jgi:hypothetical protein